MIKFELKVKTSPDWIQLVGTQLESFLCDHAAAERKASATGINFVVQYPDRVELTGHMIQMAREELLHFQQVHEILRKRKIHPTSDKKNPYIQKLLGLIRNGRDARLLDRLLVFGITELRGAERFGIVGREIPDLDLRGFYQKLALAEVRHHDLFIELALKYFSESEVSNRVEELLSAEAEILTSLPVRPTVH